MDEPYRQTLLNIHDDSWSFHLEDMRNLKQGVQWVSVAEKDPEIEYSFRAFDAFKSLLANVRDNSVKTVVPQLMLAAQ